MVYANVIHSFYPNVGETKIFSGATVQILGLSIAPGEVHKVKFGILGIEEYEGTILELTCSDYLGYFEIEYSTEASAMIKEFVESDGYKRVEEGKKRRAKEKEERLKEKKRKQDKFEKLIMESIAKALGPDNVDWQGSCVVIKYDTIHMTNSRGNTHTINDMYIQLPLSGDKSHFTMNFGGFRGRLSYAEKVSNYAHSHLHSIPYAFHPFCTGTDGINDMWSELKMFNMEMADKQEQKFCDMMEGFVHQMHSFLAYESLEGGPYKRIRNISPYRRSAGLGWATINRSVRDILYQITPEDMDFSIDLNTGNAYLVETDHLHDVCASLVRYHQMRDSQGHYFDLDDGGRRNINEPERVLEDKFIHFKGNLVKTIVEAFNSTNNQNDTVKARRFCHGKIFDRFREIVEERVNDRLDQILIKQHKTRGAVKEKGDRYPVREFDATNLVLAEPEPEQGVERSPVLEDQQGSGAGESGNN